MRKVCLLFLTLFVTLSHSFDHYFVQNFYFIGSPFHTCVFSITFILWVCEVTFTTDDINRILSLHNVHDPSFFVISFEFENIHCGNINDKFLNISFHDITMMVHMMVRPNHGYGEGSLNDNASACVHPHSQTFLVTLS